MCTITYLPLSGKSCLLTQNRDESPLRQEAVFPIRQERHGRSLLFPQDPAGGGSWIATDSRSRVVSLMNGGIGQHMPQPPYRLSRGQILLDAAAADSIEDFMQTYPLENIEPFTLLAFEQQKDLQIRILKWDGQQRYLQTADASKPHIWSAPQLYTAEQHKLREKWFREWLNSDPNFTAEAALDFHLRAGDGNPEHSLLLNRQNLVKTVSISQAIVEPEEINILYHPLSAKQTIRKAGGSKFKET